MTSTTNGADRCQTLAGENTSPAPFVVRWRSFVPPLVVMLAIIALFLIPEASSSLEFDRAALARGELWRLFTGHFVHFDASHLVWDAGAFALLAGLLSAYSPRRWLWLVGGSALFISAGVWLLQPQFGIYRGLSGIDCALFGAVLVERYSTARRERDRLALAIVALATIGFAAKCVFELHSQSTTFVTSSNFVPVPLAHLLGAVSGGLIAGRPQRLQQQVHASEGPA